MLAMFILILTCVLFYKFHFSIIDIFFSFVDDDKVKFSGKCYSTSNITWAMDFPFQMSNNEYNHLCNNLPFFGLNYSLRMSKIKFNSYIGKKYEDLKYFEYYSGYGLEKLGCIPFLGKQYKNISRNFIKDNKCSKKRS